MKKNILGKFALMIMTAAALVGGASLHYTPLTTNAESAEFDCEYGVNDKTDPFISNGYGATEVITYTESEATAAGVPAGFSGEVLSVFHTATNRGIMLDFSSQNIPIKYVESITFRIYMSDDGISDGYPELRIPEPYSSGGWVMRYNFADKTDAWQEVVLKDGNGSFFNNGSRTADFNMLAKDGYLYKFELAMRHNGSSDKAFYIDSVKVGYVADDGVAPVLTYNGEDEVTIAKGQQLNFDVSAVDAEEGEVDVEYVWGDPSRIEADGKPMGGTHTLTFVARDFFGNTTEKTITVIVKEPDVTPPTLVVPVDTIYAKIGAKSLLTFTASDDKGGVTITTVWSEGALDRYERLTQGTHTLTITATDLSGNKTEKVVTFIVTEDGDTADVVIDEEEICPDWVDPDLLPDDDSTSDDSTSDDSTSDDANSDNSTSDDSTSDDNSSEDSTSSEDSASDEDSVNSGNSSTTESGNNQQDEQKPSDTPAKAGCGSSLGVMAGLPLLVAGAFVLLKKKEN